MKQRLITQVEVIQDSDAQAFKQKVNDRLRELGEILELSFPEEKGFCALIKYEVSENIPEDSSEKYYLANGKYYHCNDCPFLELDPDRRSISHWCGLKNDRVRLKDIGCDTFYEGLIAGNYHLVTPEERKKQYEEMNEKELKIRRQKANINRQVCKAKRKAAEVEREAIVKHPRYCYLFTDKDTDELDSLRLTSEEIAFLLYGKFKHLDEDKLIDIARERHAVALHKTPSLYDNTITVLYEDESITE